jgi:hypothetical protein
VEALKEHSNNPTSHPTQLPTPEATPEPPSKPDNISGNQQSSSVRSEDQEETPEDTDNPGNKLGWESVLTSEKQFCLDLDLSDIITTKRVRHPRREAYVSPMEMALQEPTGYYQAFISILTNSVKHPIPQYGPSTTSKALGRSQESSTWYGVTGSG